MYESKHNKNPINVALLTAAWLSALSEITTAPSIPMKDHNVTSIVLFICPPKFPKSTSWRDFIVSSPQKLVWNIENLKTNIETKINNAIGTNLAIVPIILILAAWRTPAIIMKYIAHINIEPPITEGRLFPPLKCGGKK